MQDRFKFRVWDETEKNMVYFDGVFYNKKPYTEGSSFPQYDSTPHYHKLSDLMQSTGLKDKNGKLIYEGDIAKFKDNITTNGSKTHIAVIEHNETFNVFMYRVECMGLFTVNKVQNENFDVEVIGNIYENPELLEG